jgi:4'-phosphopantetheinyl transferase EntD
MIKAATTSAAAPSCLGQSFAFAICSATEKKKCPVHPGEELLLSDRVSGKKKLEFALGREAARQALRQIGYESDPAVLRGPGGEPLWPQGIVGSISHCYPWGVAVVAEASKHSAVGIDLESAERLQETDISNLVCENELQWVQEGRVWERLLMVFSAKEAVYKAFYPIYRRYIDFKQVELCWLSDQRRFQAKFLTSVQPEFVPERFGQVCCHQADGFTFSCLICHFN